MNPTPSGRSALVIGESLMDIVTRATGAVEHPGGSPMNVSVGLSRLGLQVRFLTHLGDDQRGIVIADRLERVGVELVLGPTSGHRTSTANAVIDQTGAAHYEFDLEWILPEELLLPAAADVVHFGSIGAFLEPGAGVVRAIVTARRAGSTITFDPNVRPQLQGERADARRDVEQHVALSDVVKASDEDLAWLYPGRDIAAIATDWLALGASLVVVTKGDGGAAAYCGDREVSVSAHRVEVVDTIGAGDSFMSGLIRALGDEDLLGAERRESLSTLDEPTLRRVVDFAASTAALTVARAGAEPPTSAELEQFRSGPALASATESR